MKHNLLVMRIRIYYYTGWRGIVATQCERCFCYGATWRAEGDHYVGLSLKEGVVEPVITPFLPPGFSRVSARKTRQPEPSRPVPTRAHHLEYSQKEGPRHISQGLTKFD
jgi:hypothetical protein